MTRARLDELPEYSCTLPTGTTPGKKWKRDVNFHARRDPRVMVAHLDFWSGRPAIAGAGALIQVPPEEHEPQWVLGEYFELPDDPTRMGIRWTPIELIELAKEMS